GEKWWLETAELESLASVEQDERRARDEWELPVCEWVGQRNEVTVREVIKGALGLSASHSAEIRVVKILKHHLGFKQCRPEQKGKRYVCYRREQLLDSAPKHTAPKHNAPKHTAPKRKRPKLRRRPPRKNHRGR
ncbi:MAG: hypothetical protein ACXVH6_06460, partial [Halobacteriota archaeon]